MHERLCGQDIVGVQIAQTPHGCALYSGDEALYEALLQGKGIQRIYAQGGGVIVQNDSAHLRLMDGANIRYIEAGGKRPAKHQLLLEIQGGACVVCTVQIYAGLYVVPGDQPHDDYARAAQRAVSPLSEGFDRAYFDALFGTLAPKDSVKALLATKQRIPGLGNGCLHDILYNARIAPQAKALELSDAQKEVLFQEVKSTLAAMVQGGGRDTEKDFYGEKGGYHVILSAKTLIFPCRRCGGGIVRKAYMGGNVYYCPTCQMA